ncbi:squalene--hopene cyclase [Methylocella sp.]|uniref:squalene--hopene cyclase n=1 Tax=Methylocella sp. TaxID=1978226 RepID=UPI003784DECB
MDDRAGAFSFGAAGAAPGDVEAAVSRARAALLARQQADGHFVFELEADATIPAEYVLFRHFLGDPAPAELERKIAVYLRRRQTAAGGWPLFAEGVFNVSASVKAYFALKMIGDDPEAAHMKRARAAILAHGGAAQANVFTRSLLALFGEVPWSATPVMPVEIMLLPRWFPFHISKISYWARAVIVPLTVVNALKPKPVNPRGVGVRELFVTPPETVRRGPAAPHQAFPWTTLFDGVDRILRRAEPHMPKGARKTATERAVAFVEERLNGEDGLGAIFPAMVYSALMLHALGAPLDDPRILMIRRGIEKLLVVKDDEAYCQPCVSPVWDTALASHALLESAGAGVAAEAGPEAVAVRRALDWLKPLQELDVKGDWAMSRPKVRPGGWAFQYANPHYPDLDDTAVVAMAMERAGRGADAESEAGPQDGEAIARAREWILGLQSRNGGFAAFDADNDHDHLNYIPFADHGALLDPPTADVAARCVSFLAQLGERPETNPALARALDYLLREQEAEGSWYGRWGMNYIYGTWSVVSALNAVGLAPDHPALRRAADWLKRIQNLDGGWGEDGASYELGYKGYDPAPSTASQTAWALIALMAAGEVDSPEVAAGIAYLARTQGEDGFWEERRFTATGFPRVFYLRYHGYPKFFPLWALARYRNLKAGNALRTPYGM